MKHKKALITAIVFTLCLALMGCGQSSVKPAQSNIPRDTVNQTEDYTEEQIEDKTAETESEQIADAEVDNMNPRQDVEGLYVYNVQGHEIRTRTNIWDYIGEVKVDGVPYSNYFRLYKLAEDLGYDEMYNFDGLYKHTFDDGSYIYSGFQHDGSSGESNITSGLSDADNNLIASGVLYVTPYNSSTMEYRYNIGDYMITLDMIILCTYAFEYYADGNDTPCWENIFGTMSPRISQQ